MHYGKGSTGKFTSNQSNVGKHVNIFNILSIKIFLWLHRIILCPGMFSKSKTFPQCTPYICIYTDIYQGLNIFANSCIYIERVACGKGEYGSEFKSVVL